MIEKTGNDFKPRKGKNQHAFSTDITRDEGWVILEMEGTDEALDNAEKYCAEQGVRISAAEGDVLES